MNIKEEIERTLRTSEGKIYGKAKELYLNDIEMDPLMIQAVMINEIVAEDEREDFYGKEDAAYLQTTLSLFARAGKPVTSIQEINKTGVYITNAVKRPKTQYTVDPDSMKESLPFLEAELSLFPNVKVIMLMGDVAKKMVNSIVKRKCGKNVIPSVSTYKLRENEFYFEGIRVIPSYIITGKNILIEKAKAQMVTEDIEKMYQIIQKK